MLINPNQEILLSIIIVSYNTCDVTRKCLESIIRQVTDVNYEIIVVDNASTDGSADMVAIDFPSVRLIRSTINRGFAVGQNIGLSHAEGRYLLILNSDVLLVGNTPRILIDHLLSDDPSIGAIGPQILNPDQTIAPSARRSMRSRPMIALGVINKHFPYKHMIPEHAVRQYLGFLLKYIHDNFAPHNDRKYVDFVDGMCVLIKREVLEDIGLFDEQFFFDSEILDLSNRIRAAGWKILFFPEAQVIHLGQVSRKKFSSIIIETHRSDLIYFAKYAPKKVPFIRKTIQFVVFLKMIFRGFCLLLGIRRKNMNQQFRTCGYIQDVCHRFDAVSVRIKEKIPTLIKRSNRLIR